MPSKHIDQCIEALCAKGCRSVRRDIHLLEQGVVLPELAVLDAPARRAVLQELQAIMAVYGDSCPVTATDKTFSSKRDHGTNS